MHSSKAISKKDNALYEYTKDKCVRIASVVSSVTALMDKDSVMREALDKTAITLTKDAVLTVSSAQAREALARDLDTLAALCMVAGDSGRIAKETARILGDECLALRTFLHEAGYTESASIIDARSLAGVPTDEAFETYPHKRPIETYVGQPTLAHDPQAARSGTPAQRDTLHAAPVTDRAAQPVYRERVQENQKDRRAVILGLLQRKDRVNVKDVAQVIKDVSEKTIQRELLALVAQGVLVKEGERRWSTYRLA